MGEFHYKTEQHLPIEINHAWEFFSSPANLAVLTPREMGFKVLRKPDNNIYEGMVIDYSVKPLFHIPLHWKTKILEVEELVKFTDVQLKGPFKLWQHTHHFIQLEKGVLMKDEVKYSLPFGIVGNIAHSLLVKKKIERIFLYRKKVLEKLFPKSGI